MNQNPVEVPWICSTEITDRIPPFQSPIKFEFDPEVNVFIGPNATGKSTILKLLCQEFPRNRIANFAGNRFTVGWGSRRARPPLGWSPLGVVQVYLPPVRDVALEDPGEYRADQDQIGPKGVSDGFLQRIVYQAAMESIPIPEFDGEGWDSEVDFDEVWSFDDISGGVRAVIASSLRDLGLVSKIAAGKRLNDTLLQSFGWDIEKPENDFEADRREEIINLAFTHLGKEEFVREARRQLQEVEGGRFLLNGADPYTSFPAVRVKMALDRLRQENRARWVEVIQVAGDCCSDICPEVRIGPVENWREVEYLDGVVVSEISHPGEGAVIRGASGTETIYVGNLSTGTQGLWWWITWVALKMESRYQGLAAGWQNQPATLLIDEIENHLHPTWQRRVIPALRKHFPMLQIFATTHSPFVVAGLKRGQVHLLNRDADGVVTASTNERDVIGWTADEILQTMMGVDEPTDQLTVDRATHMRELREKEKLTPEEEVELNELRRQVNADLLDKGGTSDIELDDYATLMRQVLLSRQSDLTQDGG